MAPQTLAAPPSLVTRWARFHALTKPRVVQLIVFCALIGMLLAQPGWPDWARVGAATLGIWLVASAAAAFNCLVEQQIDRRMQRTAWRPTAKGELTNVQTLAFAGVLCGAGSAVLYAWVNPLTMWLTFATFVGYAVVYTVVLKPLTPQNIVIGGASGAMPPLLGWAAMTGEVGAEALLLTLIIFLWTPPHFWALALYRAEDYRRAGLPMLPITHGPEFTRLQVFLYTIVLFAATLLPFVHGMSGWFYLVAALLLGVGFMSCGWRLWRRYSDALARHTFRFSIWHLSLLFAALLLDHYLAPWINILLWRAALIAGVAAALAGCGRPAAPQFKGVDITGADYARELELTDADGRPRRLSDFKGKVTVVFFGFTHCPDVCPTTLLELATVRKALGADGDKLQGVFVTVDPERDTAEVLKAYVGNFGADFVALRGSPERTKEVARHFKVYYARSPGKTEGSYSIDHTAGSYIYDKQGRVRLFTRYGGGAEALRHDVQLLLNEPA